MISSLDHLVLTVADLEATIRFYCHGLGMEARRFGPKRERCALHFGDQKINLHERGKEFEPKATLPTPGSADLKTQLESAGLQVIEGPVERSGATDPILSIYLRDPDGNLIEIANRQHAGAST